MQSPNIFQNFDLPYAPLPQAAYDAARISLLKRDFPEESILKEYSISSRSKEHTIKINALVFAHPTHRSLAEYASVTIYNAVNGQNDEALVSILAESAAPFHIIHRDNQFSFWASSVKNNQPEPLYIRSDISYDQLDDVLSNYAVDLKPQRIIDAKQGRDTFTLPIFRNNIQPLQLSFWATDVTRKLLVDHFALAVDILRKHTRQRHDTGAYDKSVTSLAIQLLGALILADTGVLGNEIRLKDVSLKHLIEIAHSRFDRYFQPELIDTYWEAAAEAYQILRQIRYAGFAPDMLSEIYKAAFSKEQRKKLGRYDTPLYLTRRIWQNIPVEYLPPDQRYVADMTCGWGSFLVAGHERLSNLDDAKVSLREQLRGNDIDYSTARLAGLGLLLSTSEDSWYIDDEDALSWSWLETHRPNIIVGNPPFGSVQDSSLTGEDGWYETANKFLAYAIDRLTPGGYLAMLMPRSFTSALASPEYRKQLLENCDVLELWELPISIFPDARAQTMVVFAQKKTSPHISTSNPVRLRTLQPETLDSLKDSGKFTSTASGIVIDQSAWKKTSNVGGSKNTHIIDYHIILPEYTWRTIGSHCVNLQDRADIIKGASEGKPENRKKYADSKQVLWITGVRKVMLHPFFLDYKQARMITYPDDLERPRLNAERILAGEKVIVVYDPHPSWGKRNKLAIERKNHYVSDSFWVVAPNALAQQMGITCEVLAAVLNWDVSNAWIVEHLKNPAIPKRAMKTIPFPKNLSKDDCKALTEAVRKIEEAALLNKDAPLEATQTIDTILRAVYHLDDATFARLRKIIEWDTNPQITLDIQPDQDKATWMLSGIVDSVHAEQGTITLWMEGFHELQTVQIVPSMPGWMLRPGAAFRTKIPDIYIDEGKIDLDAVDWGAFLPQPYTYMSEEELLAELSTVLREDDKYRIG